MQPKYQSCFIIKYHLLNCRPLLQGPRDYTWDGLSVYYNYVLSKSYFYFNTTGLKQKVSEMSRHEANEGVPLLPTGVQTGNHGSRSARIQVERETELWDEEAGDEILFAEKQRKGTSLVLNDAILLILYFLQMLALMMAMALRWPWPSSWLSNNKFVFLFNLDIWEFLKLYEDDVYVSAQGDFVLSDSVGISYWLILLIWALFLFIALVAYIITYAIIAWVKHPHLFMQHASLKRAYIIIAQVIAIPLGVAMAKVFHCNDNNRVDVHNDIKCFESTHWAYLVPVFAVAVLFYIIFPVWLILKTKSEMLSMSSDRHEGYLQLKEAEYVHGLDVLWAVGGFHVFSSFKKRGAHYRAAMHVVTAVILVFYAALPHHMFAQALLINLILFCAWVAFIVIRPYRVTSFNVMLILTFLCLNCNCMMGCLVSNTSSTTVRNVWLTPDYLKVILWIINIGWLVCVVLFVLYLILRHCGCWRCCCREPLWPSMTSNSMKTLSPETRKFVKAILRGRILVGECTYVIVRSNLSKNISFPFLSICQFKCCASTLFPSSGRKNFSGTYCRRFRISKTV